MTGFEAPKSWDPINRSGINRLLEDNTLNPTQLMEYFTANSFVREQMDLFVIRHHPLTLETHTEMVLIQFKKYFSQVKFSFPFSHNLFIVTLILHDLGKPKAILDGDKALQHKYTVPVLENFLEAMDFTPQEIRVSTGLIGGDPIGEFLKKNQTDPNIPAGKIKKMSQKSGMDLKIFWEILLVYYQVDASAYTEDAGWRPALDHLFCFDPENRRMDLNQSIMDKVEKIKIEVFD